MDVNGLCLSFAIEFTRRGRSGRGNVEEVVVDNLVDLFLVSDVVILIVNLTGRGGGLVDGDDLGDVNIHRG